MSMSTSVIGIRPPDAKWKEMKAVWDACVIAKCDPPSAVGDFFEWTTPDDAGVVVDDLGEAEKEWHNDYASGYEIDLEKLPKGIKVLRFFNSW